MEEKLSVVLYSFGFKHGVPVDANMVWDVRFLPNPYWQEALRPLTGQEQKVADYVVKSEQGKIFLTLLKPLLDFFVAEHRSQDKRHLRLAIGCTGGRHRSVAIVEAIGQHLHHEDIKLTIFHRDIGRFE